MEQNVFLDIDATIDATNVFPDKMQKHLSRQNATKYLSGSDETKSLSVEMQENLCPYKMQEISSHKDAKKTLSR